MATLTVKVKVKAGWALFVLRLARLAVPFARFPLTGLYIWLLAHICYVALRVGHRRWSFVRVPLEETWRDATTRAQP